MQRITFRIQHAAYAWLLPMLVITWAMPVYAEQADRDKPIDLEADSVIVDDAKQRAVEEGAKIIAAAKAEGQLTVIALARSWCGYGPIIDAFKAKYGHDKEVGDPSSVLA